MIDPIVERQYSDCRELLNLWRRYHDFFKVAVSGDGITPENEHEFITIKSRIAMLHDPFMDVLDHDQNIGQNVLSIVTRSITLKHVHRMSTAEIKKIELEWHESYLLLNETLGMLEDKRKQFTYVTPSQYYRRLYTKKIVKTVRDFISGWVFKTVMIIAGLMVGIFLFLQFGGVDWALGWAPTRKAVIKCEDLIRLAFKNYAYRELALLERMDRVAPDFVNIRRVNAKNERGYECSVGMSRVAEKLRGNANDFSEDLKQNRDCRSETYEPAYGFGGGEAIAWLYRMPTSQIAQAIEGKYNAWYGQLPVGQPPDWVFFRRSNIVGVVFAGDNEGRIRNWVRGQYLHIRRK